MFILNYQTGFASFEDGLKYNFLTREKICVQTTNQNSSFLSSYQHRIDQASMTERGGSKSFSCRECPNRVCICEAKISSRTCR